MIETIKEYLVSLGFKTDNSSLNAAQAAMKKAENSVDSFANSSVKSFAKAAVGVVTFVATANLALGKFIVELAQADLQTEMFARKMWMSKDAAKAYQSSIDALGVSVNDLYLSTELMDKYLDLNRQARDMGVPAEEYDKQMRGVRDITFQFQRLKLEGTYALQWIGYYLTKYLAGPLGDIKGWLTKVNDEVQRTMPIWTKRVAEVASWFVRLGKAAWSIRDALGAVVGVLAGFKMISMLTNPLGLLILGMTALLLLVDDFNTFKDGGKSAFPRLWEWVERFKKSLEDDGTIGEFKNLLQDVLVDVKEFGDWLEKIGKSDTFKNFLSDSNDLIVIFWHGIQNTWNWLMDLGEQLRDSGALDSFGESLGEAWGSVVDLTDAIGDLLNSLGGEGGLGDLLTSGIISALNVFTGTLEEIAGLVTIIAGGIKGLTTGDFSGLEKGAELFRKGLSRALDNPIGKAIRGEDSKDEATDKLKKAMTPRSSHTSDSGGGPTPSWSSFRDSIPGASDVSTVDWSSLRKGFVAFMNSIPKEFGDITKGLFQSIKGYSDSGSLAGVGASMNYLYPQNNTSLSPISMKQTYHIYGASNPEAVATTVNRSSTAMMTRTFQGVIR
ncbi:hypothetical protein E4K67_22415 [Desulfosporosinus fructosivorans]|uniref:Phage tail tape measure protein n=1 Tax=Desulfosporosinus fructosivorans TaxID=2018669 RepID=A0A4Z0R0Z6_9FIRM|nr:hypothetical protein [Desulfosporosinus fructosivorans]TGE35873.1 hypothetical protein E4K67_22415 [Desulfosporosinus fructosivorans]